jgi:F0F1-type ATP synthase membrane subunit b/b'
MTFSRGKLFLWIVVALLVCVLAGYVWGRSGRGALESTVDDVKQQLDLAEARGEILDGRVSLYNNNFGDASRHFETAKAPLQRVKQRYQDESKREAVASIETAATLIEEAQRMAGKLDPGANNKAGQALDAIRAASK